MQCGEVDLRGFGGVEASKRSDLSGLSVGEVNLRGLKVCKASKGSDLSRFE